MLKTLKSGLNEVRFYIKEIVHHCDGVEIAYAFVTNELDFMLKTDKKPYKVCPKKGLIVAKRYEKEKIKKRKFYIKSIKDAKAFIYNLEADIKILIKCNKQLKAYLHDKMGIDGLIRL